MLLDEMLYWKRFVYLRYGFRPFRASEFASEARIDVNDATDLLNALADVGVVDKIETRQGTWYVLADRYGLFEVDGILRE